MSCRPRDTSRRCRMRSRMHLSVATTAVRARHVFEQLAPSDVTLLAAETLGDGHTLALVFGREE